MSKLAPAMVLGAMLALGGCGGSQGTRLTARGGGAGIEVPEYLLEMAGASSGWLARPESGSEALQTRARGLRGDERRRAFAQLAVAHLWEAENELDERRAKRHRRDANEAAQNATNRTRDDSLVQAMAFVSLVVAWRNDSRNSDVAAERFVERHRTAGDLHLLGWIVRGEIAFDARRWDQAATAYRYLLGEMEHPLYAFALYRTAHVYREQGRAEDSRQALTEVDALGNGTNVRPEVLRVADSARRELGLGPRPAPTAATPE